MFDSFKQAGAMAGLMKDLPKLQARAKEVTEMLEAARVIGEAGGGAVRARADGRGRLMEVIVAPALSGSPGDIGPLVTEAVRDAQAKATALAAHEFGRAVEELNLPIPAEALRGLLGGGS